MAKLGEIGEFPFIDSIARLAGSPAGAGVKVGIGDDAAVVHAAASTVLTTDTQRENVHFRRDWLSAAELGRRAFRIAVSDIAAMGAAPRYALLSFGAPADLDARWARAAIRALIAEARRSNTRLVGGNLSRDDAISFVVTIIAQANAEPILRNGACPGDSVWVTGSLGGAAAGIELLRAGARSGSLIAAYRKPPLRVELARALARARMCSAMIDISDGLLADLGHLCSASRVSARLDLDAIPIARGLRHLAARHSSVRHAGVPHMRRAGRVPQAHGQHRLRHPLEYALGGGDDYELLFTVRGHVREAKLEKLCAAHGCVVSRIGTIVTGRGATLTDTSGKTLDRVGYEHFALAPTRRRVRG